MDTSKEIAETVNDVAVVHQGAQIILPLVGGKPMEYDDAIRWMKRKKEEENQEVRVYHELACSPLDGAVAFQRALAQNSAGCSPCRLRDSSRTIRLR